MAIFTQSMLADLQRLPGASHSFLKQLAEDHGAVMRTLAGAHAEGNPSTEQEHDRSDRGDQQK